MNKTKRFIFLAAAVVLAACKLGGGPGDDAIDNAGDDTGDDAYTLGNLDFPVTRSNYPAPFSKGVNFSEWFQSSSVRTIPFTRYTEETFKEAKSLGVDVVRLPLNLHHFTAGAPAYTLDPLFFSLLDQAVDWAEKHKLYLILDNHSFDPRVDTPEDIGDILIPVWTQMAEHYKNRGPYIMYEILNEPHDISDEAWGTIQGEVITAIRLKDTAHTIIVGGGGYNSYTALASIPEYDDTNLIYTFHFYDPYLFTHQGAAWGTPDMSALKGVPFPSDAHAIPELPAELQGEPWINKLKTQYPRDGQPEALARALNAASAFSNDRKAPVLCGEFGVYMPNSLQPDRVRWYTVTARFLDERGIARTSWDYFGGFGLFKTPAGGSVYAGLNIDIVKALGFTPPKQQTIEKTRSGFVLYDDYPRNSASMTWAATDNVTTLSVYDDKAAQGVHCIVWENPRQYHSFSFNFPQNNVDWAYLKNQGHALSFKVKTDTSVSFDVRFVNPENASSVPWRMNFTVTSDAMPPDGHWHSITIPFAEMKEQGAWISATGEWRPPVGQFSWENIASLSFVAEKGPFTGSIRFDAIEVVRP
jgi:endoglucanase